MHSEVIGHGAFLHCTGVCTQLVPVGQPPQGSLAVSLFATHVKIGGQPPFFMHGAERGSQLLPLGQPPHLSALSSLTTHALMWRHGVLVHSTYALLHLLPFGQPPQSSCPAKLAPTHSEIGGHGAFTHCTFVVLQIFPSVQPPHASTAFGTHSEIGGHGAFTHCTFVVLHVLPSGQPPQASTGEPVSGTHFVSLHTLPLAQPPHPSVAPASSAVGAVASGTAVTFFSVAHAANTNTATSRSVFMARTIHTTTDSAATDASRSADFSLGSETTQLRGVEEVRHSGDGLQIARRAHESSSG